MMFIRLYRKEKLIVTIPVDDVNTTIEQPRYESYNTGLRVSARSKFLNKKYRRMDDVFVGIAFVNSYGSWRLTQGMEKLIGARTGVTFTRMEIVS